MRTQVVVFALMLPLAASAQDTFTPQHVAKLRVVTEAVISPDGTQVAYVLSVPREIPKEKDGGAWTELHVVDTKGNSTPFITGQVNVANIGWTADGKQIAFLAKRDKDKARSLYVIDPKGGEARKILEHGADIQGYSFKGDGSSVAFLATDAPTAERRKQQDQGFNQEVYEEDTPFTRVWVHSFANPEKPTQKLDLKGSASELHWNPKESMIAVALTPTPGIDDHIMFRKVHVIDLQTGKVTNLNNPGKLGQVAWSPDGKKLAMITGADKHDPRESCLWLFDPIYFDGWLKWTGGEKGTEGIKAGAKAKEDGVFGHAESVAWENERIFFYQGSVGVSTVVWRLERKGAGGDTAIHDAEEIRSSGEDVVLTSISRAKKAMSFIGQTPNHPPEVYFSDPQTKGTRRLTDSNPWLKNMKFAKQEVVKYKAKDGLELEGVLIRPLNEEKGKRYPLVLTVHGGPEAHYSNGWLTMYHSLGQVAAAKGMAVFYPNYRGSTGYGVEFSMKGQKDAGGKEFDDLIDGVDHLVNMGLVDDKKVGITGGSYGGYATAWGSTYYSHRFAAGVMFVGISDWISCSGTTDIPQEMFLVHHRKWLWDDWDYFRKASPINYVHKHKTPLLIMHGKADPRVNPGQSLEFYRHLKLRNQAPVRLVLYPGEGHGNKRAASKLDYNIRLLQWMDHYLKGPGGKMPAMEIDYGLPASAINTGASWDDRSEPNRVSSRSEPWLGRGCPCCIGGW